MTKEITKAIILQEMQDKLDLREFEPTKFLFEETVIPTYDIGQHLKRWSSRLYGQTVVSSGGILFFTVPQDQRWALSAYDMIFVSGVYTVAGMYICRIDKNDVGATVYLDLAAAQSVSYHTELKKLVYLEPGDKIYVNIDGYTSPGVLRVIMDAMLEDIR